MLLLKGKPVSDSHKAELEIQLAKLKEEDIHIAMAIVVVGDNHGSHLYAKFLQRKAEEIGFKAHIHALPVDATEAEVCRLMKELNEDETIYGILPMMPMPPHIHEDAVLENLSPAKDIDGLTIWSIGLVNSGRPGFTPCTPTACLAILDYYNIPIEGKQVAIVGRSKVVGRPVSNLLLQRHGTVTICHSRTENLHEILKKSDIVVAALGKANALKGHMLKEGAIVIDVGINELDGKTVGDVDFDTVEGIVSAITPVPGGVGSVTTMMTLEALYRAYKAIHEERFHKI